MKNESRLYKLKDKALYFPQSFPVGHLQKVLDCTKQALTSDSLNLKFFEIAPHRIGDLNKPLILNVKLQCVTHSSPFVLQTFMVPQIGWLVMERCAITSTF